MEAIFSGSMEIVTSVSEENCKWHKQSQRIKTIKDLINSHEVTSFGEEASKASREWNKKFKEGKKGGKDGGNERGPTEWEKIQTFLVIPLFFEMKELQLLVEDELRDDLRKKKRKSMTLALEEGMISEKNPIFLCTEKGAYHLRVLG